MTVCLFLLILFVTLSVLFYHRVPLWASTLIFAVLLAAWTFYRPVPWVLWILFALIAIPLNVLPLRRMISAPVLDLFRKIMPRISDTEQEALNAGSIFWEADLFSGKPDWRKLMKLAPPKLSDEERAFLDGPVEEVCAAVNDWRITHIDADLPEQTWQFLKDKGFFGMIIPKAYGGLEFSAYAHAQVLIKLNSVSTTLGTTVSVPNSLGPAELLLHYGTEAQKDHYLPRLARGEEIPCFALTAPEAGSDAGAIADYGIVCKGEWEGKEVLGMKLTWNKRYITLAPVATVLGLAFKLSDPEGLLRRPRDYGITCALIPVNTPGVEIGRRHWPLSIPFQNGPTWGKDVFVPLDFIIGGPERAGHGWRMLVDCLSAGRAISLPSGSIGGAKMAAYTTGAYARIRRQFRVPVGFMEGVMEALARIAGKTYAMDAAGAFTAAAIDQGAKPSVASAIVKSNVTRMGQEVSIDSMDVHGGKGIMLGPKNYTARPHQGSPISITVEGANILTRSLIIFGQGAIRCHPFVLQEIAAAQTEDRDQAIKAFDKALFGHIGHVGSNKVRAIWMGLTNSLLVMPPVSGLPRRYLQHMSRFSAQLAFLADLAMTLLGGELKRRESLSGRLGDMMSQLYIASAVLKRFADKGEPRHDEPLVRWAVEDALYRTQEAAFGVLHNFPVRWMGVLLKIVLFPFGRPVKPPSDKLGRVVARLLQTPGDAREELTDGILKTVSETTNIGKVNKALLLQLEMEPIIKKLSKALDRKPESHEVVELAHTGLAAGLITQLDVDLVEKAEAARLEVIHVDDFAPEELTRPHLQDRNGDD